jgi:hypothetical protein
MPDGPRRAWLASEYLTYEIADAYGRSGDIKEQWSK